MPPVRFRLGADPEFLFLTSTKMVVPASECAVTGSSAEFGCDAGHGTPGELRPPPKEEPEELVQEIHRILVQGFNQSLFAQSYNWSAGGNGSLAPTGGHIHIGDLSARITVPRSTFPTLWFDALLAVPAAFLESPSQSRVTQENTGYGALGNVRPQDHGWEYRTLGSWLTSPYVALGVLSMAKIIYHEWMLDSDGDSALRRSVLNLADEVSSNARYFPGLRGHMREYADRAWQLIPQFALYEKYRPQIDFLKGLYDDRVSWYPACGMKAAWGIPNSLPVVGPKATRYTLDDLLEQLGER